MTHDPTFWLLARASRLHRLRPADAVGARGARAQVAALPRAEAGGRRPTRTGRSPCSGSARSPCTASRSCSTRPCGCRCWALVVPFTSSYRPVATAIGVLTAELMLLVYASFSLRKRIGAEELAPAALGDVRDLRRRHRARPHGRHRHQRGRGPSRSTSARSARSRRRPPARARSPVSHPSTSRKEQHHDVPHRDRPFALQRLRHLRRARARRLRARGRHRRAARRLERRRGRARRGRLVPDGRDLRRSSWKAA